MPHYIVYVESSSLTHYSFIRDLFLSCAESLVGQENKTKRNDQELIQSNKASYSQNQRVGCGTLLYEFLTVAFVFTLTHCQLNRN